MVLKESFCSLLNLGIMGMAINAIKNTAITITIINAGLINLTIPTAIKKDAIRVNSAVNIAEADMLVIGSSFSAFPCISRILFNITS